MNLGNAGLLADVARWGSHFVGLCFVAVILGLDVFQLTSPYIVVGLSIEKVCFHSD